MRRALYSLLLRLALPFALARLYWRARRAPAYRERIGERLARASLPEVDVWVHAVSVGEAQAAVPLIERLLARDPPCRVLVTTTTPTGAERVRARFGERVTQRYCPYDLPAFMARFLDAARPRLVLVMETEIWPNLLACCAQRHIPVGLVNARLSARSARGYARLGRFTRETLRRFAWIAAQSEADAERFIALGADPERAQVTGSLKFDVEPPADLPARAAAMRRAWGQGRPVWIAASTREGEEARILEAHRLIRAHLPEALLVLVPRHPERFDPVARLVKDAGLKLARRRLDEPCTPDIAVYLGDTMGELPLLIAASDAAFIGGTLAPRGGQNPLEAAAASVPLALGPHTFNFTAISAALIEAGGAVRVSSPRTLADSMRHWLEDTSSRQAAGMRARQTVERHRGALERIMVLIAPALEDSTSTSGRDTLKL
ncbi:MAG: lipid IV(A) 3-deoxy-D-manno-octulosonic acid transferase [Chromatiaceae bacterium]|nr:lipid IV(A) 3-deoxy-D-manno-octulosonic acid transferase [Chromatiaceae bacterium]